MQGIDKSLHERNAGAFQKEQCHHQQAAEYGHVVRQGKSGIGAIFFYAFAVGGDFGIVQK
jgi:hypothetical protein